MAPNRTKQMKQQPIIIYGPQGSGKTQLALRIAKQRGTYKSIHMSKFLIPFGMINLLRKVPYTLIIKGVTNSIEHRVRMKQTATNSHIVIDSKGHIPFTIKTPNLIFVMDANVIPCDDLKRGRQFHVLKRNKP